MNSVIFMRLILALLSLALVGLAFVNSQESGTTSIVGWGLGYAFCYAVIGAGYKEGQEQIKELFAQLSELRERLET